MDPTGSHSIRASASSEIELSLLKENMHGDFTWIDLSTFDVSKAKAFYLDVFQWDYNGDETGYVNCTRSTTPCAGLYEMPEFFQKIKMPSFWMTYISVSDIDSVVTKATELGGKVEIEETNALGKVALIRDPAGAGFTCYEGAAKSASAETPQHGRWHWSELFVSDLAKVRRFYTELFGWTIEETGDAADRYSILNEGGERIGAVQVASSEIRSEKEFWGVFFGVSDTKKALAKINDGGGNVIYDLSNTEGTHYLANDSQGAAFFVTGQDAAATTPGSIPEKSNTKSDLKWRSLIGLIVVYLAIFFEADWLWGALFLFWVIPDLKSGTTYFIEPLNRRHNPVLYWAIVLTWIGLSAYLLINAI